MNVAQLGYANTRRWLSQKPLIDMTIPSPEFPSLKSSFIFCIDHVIGIELLAMHGELCFLSKAWKVFDEMCDRILVSDIQLE